LFLWVYVDLAKRSKTLEKTSNLFPFLMDSLEKYLMMKARPLRKYCLQHYVLALKDKKL